MNFTITSISNSNSTLLEQIKRQYLAEKKKATNSKLPSRVKFQVENETVKMKFPSTAVTLNIQDDECAFEGWALVIRRWTCYNNVEISWDKPKDINDGHYQRFLFRVDQFSKDFEWFLIAEECRELFHDYKIKETGNYLLNIPSKRDEKTFRNTKEGVLEHQFVHGNLKDVLKEISNAVSLSRQLPVGVFENVVSKKTSIFTGGKSAIDIWGFSKENELLVFELKADNNVKVGILSELYFYVSVLKMLKKQTFRHDNCNQEDILKIAKFDQIKAFFLCPSIHPLIDKKILDLLNEPNSQIKYHYINFDKDYKLNLDKFDS